MNDQVFQDFDRQASYGHTILKLIQHVALEDQIMRALPSLRSRFALSIAFLVCLLAWVLGAMISHDSSTRMRGEIGQDLSEISVQMIDRLDRDMANRAHILSVLGTLKALRDPSDLKQVRALLDQLQSQFPSLSWIGFTDMTGMVKASSNGVLENVSIAPRPVFLSGREHLSVGDVHEAVLLSKLLPNPTGEAMKFVDISLPVLGYTSNQPIGVLATHLSWAWADEIRQSLLDPMQQRRQVEFFVIGADRTILLGPKASVGQRLHLPALDDLKKGSSEWAVQTWPDGNRYLTGFASSRGYGEYTGLGWTVIARQSLDEAYAPARDLERDILIWGVGLAFIMAFIGWLLADHFTRPLRKIAHAADRLSAGEITVIPDLKGTREIEQLSQSIRQLVESLTNQQTALGVMESLAHHDPLTGLPNRAALEKFLSRAQQAYEQGQQTTIGRDGTSAQPTCLALLYLDLDGFKPVNDQFGHPAGDTLLREVALRLRGCLREGDIVARLGGDEFLMVLQVPSQGGLDQARSIAARALRLIAQPINLGARDASISCSIGGALWPNNHADLGEVLALSDQALYRAKHAGKRQAVFSGEALGSEVFGGEMS